MGTGCRRSKAVFLLRKEKKDFSSLTAQQLADEGEKIIFGGIGKNKEQGAMVKASVLSVTRSTRGCWVNALPTCLAFRNERPRSG